MMCMQRQHPSPPFSNTHTHIHVECSIYLFISPTNPFFLSNCSISNMGSSSQQGTVSLRNVRFHKRTCPQNVSFTSQFWLNDMYCNVMYNSLHSSSTSLIPSHLLLHPSILVNNTVPKYTEAVRTAKHESKLNSYKYSEVFPQRKEGNVFIT